MKNMYLGMTGQGMSLKEVIRNIVLPKESNVIITDPKGEIPIRRDGHVLIIGKTGSGKECVYHSPNRNGFRFEGKKPNCSTRKIRPYRKQKLLKLDKIRSRKSQANPSLQPLKGMGHPILIMDSEKYLNRHGFYFGISGEGHAFGGHPMFSAEEGEESDEKGD